MNEHITHIRELSFQNKYTRWYCNIIQQAFDRDNNIQGENHHIIPRSIDPNLIKDPSNIVLLTYKEHFIVHLLLRKMLKDKKHRMKMNNAILRMCVGLLRNTTQPTNVYAAKRFATIRKSIYESGVYFQTKNTIWVNDGNTSKRIPESALPQYVTNGWEIGRKTFSRRTSIDVNKDGITKRIQPNEKHQYLLDGWMLGKTPRLTVCVTNGTKNIYVDSDNIPEGFVVGSYQRPCLGRVWVTDGTTDVYLTPNQSIPPGWSTGRSNKKLKPCYNNNSGKIRINNGTIQKYHPATEVIPTGWERGGLSPKRTWTWSKNKST